MVIFAYKSQPNVGKYSLHGCYGIFDFQTDLRNLCAKKSSLSFGLAKMRLRQGHGFPRSKLIGSRSEEEITCTSCQMGVSKNRVFPKIVNFYGVFHYKLSILGYPYFWKHPNGKSKS